MKNESPTGICAVANNVKPSNSCCEENAQYVTQPRTGSINMQITDKINVYQRKLVIIMLIKNEMPVASAVHNSGVITSKIGSLVELQLSALSAPTGISHNKAKLAKSISS